MEIKGTRLTISETFRGMERDELEAYIKQSGAQANRQLRAIGKSQWSEASHAYRYIEKLHEKEASGERGLKVTRTGANFSLATSRADIKELQARATYIEKFLDAKTSTVIGTKDVYKGIYETYKENNPEAGFLSFREFSSWWREATISNFVKQYGSERMQSLREKAEGMNSEQVARALTSVGFRPDTNYDKGDKEIPIDVILDELKNGGRRKKKTTSRAEAERTQREKRKGRRSTK